MRAPGGPSLTLSLVGYPDLRTSPGAAAEQCGGPARSGAGARSAVRLLGLVPRRG